NMPLAAGFDNLRYVVAGSKAQSGTTENTASLTFNGPRTGLASWLGAPAPMASLEFVSPDASFAASFIGKEPRAMLEDLLMAGDRQGMTAAFRSETGVNLVDDIAGSMGGEVTMSVDGPILPTPSWKIAAEVNDVAKLSSALQKTAEAVKVPLTVE